MRIDITLVPGAVKRLAERAAHITAAIEQALGSGIAIDLAALIPGGTQLDAGMIAACERAIKGCNALAALADSDGVKGRLQRLGADLTALQHEQAHGISRYIHWFEIVFHDLFGKQENI